MVEGLQKGDEVITAGGILGRITKVDDQYVTVTVAEGIEVQMQRHAVQTVLPKGTIKTIQ
jgi:preprotein translocase subunit YajC